jgi:molybdopterin-guanine dinucleotide biosynthesis protein A
MDKNDIAVVIQAGGQSSRMGQNKALMDIHGKTVIERTVEQINTLGDQTFIVADDPGLYTFLPDATIIPDLYPGRGPLGGFVTAFESVKHPIIVMCACDMPFANPYLYQLELNLMLDHNADVILPRIMDRFEPLHAVYRRASCLNPAKHIFSLGGRKIIDWFPEVKVEILNERTVIQIDPKGYAFFNINTPDDYAAAQLIYLDNKS